MTVRPVLMCVLLILARQAGPVVLAIDDIGDNYDTAPPVLSRERTWLGLFIAGTDSVAERRASRLAVTRVTAAAQTQGGSNGFRIVTTPADAVLLVSGVPGLSAGPVVTAGQFKDLSDQERQASFRLGNQLYTIRLQSAKADQCDATITLAVGGRTQKLFDAAAETRTGFSCDEPHFKIHWAGDLDRDGRLDLLVTFSRKYSYFPRQLLLSSAARPQDLVAEAARYERSAQ